MSFARRHLACLIGLTLGLLLAGVARVGAEGKPSRIAFVGTDANVYYCAGNCAKPECLTCPVNGLEVRAGGLWLAAWPASRQRRADYSWPTFSPDGKKLAYVSAGRDEDGISFGVWVYDFARHDAVRIFESPNERAIYLFWLPDGQSLSFLVTEPTGLSLLLAPIREEAPVRLVTTGMPLYYDWNQTRQKLVVHTNSAGSMRAEQVSLMSLTDTGEAIDKVLSLGHAPFKSPAWSPDGSHLAYVGGDKRGTSLFVADADGKNPKAMVKLPEGENSFVWAPDSRHIAFATGDFDNSIAFHGIRLLDISDSSVRELTNTPVTAYYFSPDSRYLAYVGAPPARPYYTWDVIDLSTGKSRHLGNFLATHEESLAYRYFDQLTLSHHIWSPDSTALVFAGVLLKGAPREATGPAPPPLVWVMPADGSAPKQISEGTLAFWSPAAN